MLKSLILLFFCVFYFSINQKTVSPITAAVPPYGGTMEELSVTNGVNFWVMEEPCLPKDTREKRDWWICLVISIFFTQFDH